MTPEEQLDRLRRWAERYGIGSCPGDDIAWSIMRGFENRELLLYQRLMAAQSVFEVREVLDRELNGIGRAVFEKLFSEDR